LGEAQDGEFMAQCARNLTDYDDGFLLGKKYLIHDRDTKYTAKFDELLKDSGVKPVKLPPRSPNLNSHAERYVLSIKSECLNRFMVFGEKMLWEFIGEYGTHYHFERNHQGVGNELIEPTNRPEEESRKIVKMSRLGGVLNYYERQAA
jgi:transposase InsO family protein